MRAVAHYSDPKVLLETSMNLGKAMVGISDVKGDAVNFALPPGLAQGGHRRGIPKRRNGHTRARGSSWK